MFKNVRAYAVNSPNEKLKPFKINRREVGFDDVLIDILYCGVCHTDIHYIRNDWKTSNYPLVPGHEIIGKIIQVGKSVKKFKKNDLVGVGVIVDSCQKCLSCRENLEPYCEKVATFTYNAPDKILGGFTFGGYSKKIVVNQSFILKIPSNLDLKSTAPLLCAGITTYSPLKKWKASKGERVGIVGLGGLGHMALKFASAMKTEVFVITGSEKKKEDALRLGANGVIISKDIDNIKSYKNSFDLLINTIPVPHNLDNYLELLKRDKTMVIVGAIDSFDKVNIRKLIFGRKSIAGSLIGGISETQEMLNFCSEHNIVPEVEIIDIKKINVAYERMLTADVKYRFVIDMKSLI